jgi:hypothetical protein
LSSSIGVRTLFTVLVGAVQYILYLQIQIPGCSWLKKCGTGASHVFRFYMESMFIIYKLLTFEVIKSVVHFNKIKLYYSSEPIINIILLHLQPLHPLGHLLLQLLLGLLAELDGRQTPVVLGLEVELGLHIKVEFFEQNQYCVLYSIKLIICVI